MVFLSYKEEKATGNTCFYLIGILFLYWLTSNEAARTNEHGEVYLQVTTFSTRGLWGLNGVFVHSGCLKIMISVRQHCLPLAIREDNHKILNKCLLCLKEIWYIHVVYNTLFAFILSPTPFSKVHTWNF